MSAELFAVFVFLVSFVYLVSVLVLVLQNGSFTSRTSCTAIWKFYSVQIEGPCVFVC